MCLIFHGYNPATLIFFHRQGCVYIVEAYKVYWTSCVKGIHTGQMVLRLVEAIGKHLKKKLFQLVKEIFS